MPKDNYYLPQRRLVSQENSALVARPDVPRAKFTNTFGRKSTYDAGYIYPFLVDEILPGDHMQYRVMAMLRMATPLFPVYSNFQIDTFFFFVPCRLLWTNWEAFMGAATVTQSDEPIGYTIPQVTMPTGGFAVHSLYDHFGLPTVGQVDAAGAGSVNALPARAYCMIWNEWFRDQNVMDKMTFNTDDGPDAIGEVTRRYRAKAHDYFTSCLPWAQKFQAPSLEMTGTTPVTGLGFLDNTTASAGPIQVAEANNGISEYAWYIASTDLATAMYLKAKQQGPDAYPDLYANFNSAVSTAGISINALRESFLIQQMLERDARGGTRYTEKILSHFGVHSPDARLQRPEYIGGGSTPLNISPIAQTAPGASSVVGALGGTGTAAGQHRASYAATEHGYILGLINVRSELAYQQGLHKMWSRTTPDDFYIPSLAGLGEQAVLRREIYFRGTIDDDLVFGYQERWQEYRTRYSDITGFFRSTTTGNIDEWHTAQQFTSAPVLGATFIQDFDQGRMDRILAAGAAATNMQFIADILINREAVRPIPAFGTPSPSGGSNT